MPWFQSWEEHMTIDKARVKLPHKDCHFLTLCPAYQEKRIIVFWILKKEYKISLNRMAPDDVFLLLINPPSKNKPVQKLTAKYVFDCYEKRQGRIQDFFRRGCTRLLFYFNTNKPHSFFLQNTICIRKPQVISEGGGGRTPCILPLDPPL